jgi:hypothetical protein
MQILFGDFYVKVGREDIFKPTIGNESIRRNTNDNGVRIVTLPHKEKLVVKSTMFPLRNTHKYTWTTPDGKTYNQIYHILTLRRYIRVYSMFDLSEEPTVMLIIIWCLQKLEED